MKFIIINGVITLILSTGYSAYINSNLKKYGRVGNKNNFTFKGFCKSILTAFIPGLNNAVSIYMIYSSLRSIVNPKYKEKLLNNFSTNIESAYNISSKCEYMDTKHLDDLLTLDGTTKEEKKKELKEVKKYYTKNNKIINPNKNEKVIKELKALRDATIFLDEHVFYGDITEEQKIRSFTIL